MNLLLSRIFFAVLLSFQFSALATTTQLTDQKIIQPLFHGQPELGTFAQNFQIFRPEIIENNTPLVLFIGSEAGPGDLHKMAAPFLLQSPIIAVQADHRGYGSFSNEIDQTIPAYVTMEQAIEDFHVLIQELKKEYSGPVLLVGYSYSATLAIMLAAKYPNDSVGVYASSATVQFPKSANFHDQKMRSSWSPELYQVLSAKIQSLSNSVVGEQNYLDRMFLQTVFVGSVQYGKFAALKPYLEKTATLPTPQFISAWKGIDLQFAGGMAQEWSSGQNTLKLSLVQAQTLKFYSRYWAYQQCTELGSFFISQDSNSIFPQTFDDYSDYCNRLFGITPKIQNEWNILSLIETMTTPIIVINGANDPWAKIQLNQNSKLPQGSKFIFSQAGYHCPDREDAALEADAIWSLFALIKKD